LELPVSWAKQASCISASIPLTAGPPDLLTIVEIDVVRLPYFRGSCCRCRASAESEMLRRILKSGVQGGRTKASCRAPWARSTDMLLLLELFLNKLLSLLLLLLLLLEKRVVRPAGGGLSLGGGRQLGGGMQHISWIQVLHRNYLYFLLSIFYCTVIVTNVRTWQTRGSAVLWQLRKKKSTEGSRIWRQSFPST
jgi:hypothetical protein